MTPSALAVGEGCQRSWLASRPSTLKMALSRRCWSQRPRHGHLVERPGLVGPRHAEPWRYLGHRRGVRVERKAARDSRRGGRDRGAAAHRRVPIGDGRAVGHELRVLAQGLEGREKSLLARRVLNVVAECRLEREKVLEGGLHVGRRRLEHSQRLVHVGEVGVVGAEHRRLRRSEVAPGDGLLNGGADGAGAGLFVLDVRAHRSLGVRSRMVLRLVGLRRGRRQRRQGQRQTEHTATDPYPLRSLLHGRHLPRSKPVFQGYCTPSAATRN